MHVKGGDSDLLKEERITKGTEENTAIINGSNEVKRYMCLSNVSISVPEIILTSLSLVIVQMWRQMIKPQMWQRTQHIQ